MRFFIKAYAMHEDEVAAIGAEVQSGSVQAEDVHEGMIEGIADKRAIERLAAKGIVVQAIAQVATGSGEEEAFAGADSPSTSTARATPSSRRTPAGTGRRPRGLRAAGPQFWLVNVISGLTDRILGQIRNAGGEIVERDPSGALVVRTTTGAEQLAALPFVSNVQRYGGQETLEGTALTAPLVPARGDRTTRGLRAARRRDLQGPITTARFEAVLHRAEDADEVVAAMQSIGAQPLGQSGRIVRFLAGPSELQLIAELTGVASIAKNGGTKLFTDHAFPLIGLSAAGGTAPFLPFDGTGELVGVADTGLDDQHPDFKNRIRATVALGRPPNNSSDPDGHGTHVAGTIAGDGASSRAPGATGPGPLRGVAPAAEIYFQSVLDQNNGLGGLPDDLANLFGPAYAAGVRVHNNSWGAYLQARYDTMALDVDAFVYGHPDFLPVIAAGNEGSCRPGMQSARGFVDYPSLGAPATSKNGLTVGASRNSRTSGGLSAMVWADAWPDDFSDGPIGMETISGDPDGLAAFSSRGPCDDMRIKPDVVAPGTDIAATRSKDAPLSHFWGAYPNNRSYAFMGGTSMASPIVTGCAVLTRQYFREQQGYANPSAALIKACLINGTKRLTGTDATAKPNGDPNYHQGFGRIDMAKTLPNPASPAFDLFFADSWAHDPHLTFTKRADRRRWRIALDADGELRIALAWTDPPGRALQNQLRLILDTRDGTGKSVNWVGNQEGSAPLAFPAHDPRAMLPGIANVLTRDPHNNVQIIRVAASAGAYTLALFADSLLILPQDFALVITTPAGAAEVKEI